MANPIAHIGTPGTSSYKVDWGPRQRGQEQMWAGIGQLLHSVGEQQRQSAEKKSLSELMAFVGDGQKLLTEGTRRGIPLAKLREAVDIHSMLKPKESTSPLTNFYNPATRERKAARQGSTEAATLAQGGWLAGDPAADKPTQRRTFKGADDHHYYEDDKSRVLPDVKASLTLRRIASLNGGSGPQRAVQNLIQGSAVGGGLGFAMGGPAGAALGAAAGPLAGHAAGRLATRAGQQRANMARAIAARGETRQQARKRPEDMSLAEVMADVM